MRIPVHINLSPPTLTAEVDVTVAYFLYLPRSGKVKWANALLNTPNEVFASSIRSWMTQHVAAIFVPVPVEVALDIGWITHAELNEFEVTDYVLAALRLVKESA